MIKNTVALIKHDLATAIKNKSIFLVLFIPLFAVLCLKLVDPPNEGLYATRDGIVLSVQKQTLPTWVLMSALLVGFIIMPSQVAEEKEKKLLLGLLQTPMRETEWISAKLFLGLILTFMSVILLHVFGGFGLGDALSYCLFLAAGSFCFSSIGILLGFLCANQASARTLGVIFYLPLMLPSALSDYSHKLSAIAPILPSYQFFRPIRSIILEGGRILNFPLEWGYLLLLGTFACVISIRLIKIRWLM